MASIVVMSQQPALRLTRTSRGADVTDHRSDYFTQALSHRTLHDIEFAGVSLTCDDAWSLSVYIRWTEPGQMLVAGLALSLRWLSRQREDRTPYGHLPTEMAISRSRPVMHWVPTAIRGLGHETIVD
jgi:hypothetical protein